TNKDSKQQISHFIFRERRLELFANWRAKGGVFLIGYSTFRNLSLGTFILSNLISLHFIWIVILLHPPWHVDKQWKDLLPSEFFRFGTKVGKPVNKLTKKHTDVLGPFFGNTKYSNLRQKRIC
ncbi:hypothetical protein ABKV19_007970, partial [Rosa sericea]